MPGSVVALPAVEIPGHEASGLGSDLHPMRIMTRRAAGLHPTTWDGAARAEVSAIFDSLAPDWHTRTSPEREAVVRDALERGLPADRPTGACLELGSGIGAYTHLLAERWSSVVAVDLALEMLRRAPADAALRVLADGARLPLADGSVDAVVLINAFLFPREVDRLVGPRGVVVWVNSSGTETPIHLAAEDVATALPGGWTGVKSEAGAGTWCVMTREV